MYRKRGTLEEGKVFFAVFVVAGFVMKVVAEFVHEVFGHGLFVLLFGGEITSLYISVLWPYDLSRIGWSLPSHVTPAQMAWVYLGGILVCLHASFLTQAFLLLKKEIRWHFALVLLWFAFWTFVSSTGYLLIGGLKPFGDVEELIRLGALTTILSFSVGLIIFVIGFVALSWVLRRTLLKLLSPKKASVGVIIFWLIIPVSVVVMFANPEHGLQVEYLPLTFIPALLSFVTEFFVLPKQRADANPDNIAEE